MAVFGLDQVRLGATAHFPDMPTGIERHTDEVPYPFITD
jgi:hypothetical protein